MKIIHLTVSTAAFTAFSPFLLCLLLNPPVGNAQSNSYNTAFQLNESDNLALLEIKSNRETDFIQLEHNAKLEKEAVIWHPTCTGDDGICANIALYFQLGYCLNIAGPTYCICAKNLPYVLDWAVLCPDDFKSLPNPSSHKPNYKLLSSSPLAILAFPYPAGSGNLVYSGKFPLVPVPKPSPQKQGADPARKPTSDSAEDGLRNARTIGLCKKNCSNPMKWTFHRIDPSDILKGYFIQEAGDKGSYLYLGKKNELSFISNPAELPEVEKAGLVWFVGAGSFDKEGKTTGFRILTATNLQTGLAVNKRTGVVSVQQIFDEEPVTLPGGENLSRFVVNPVYESIWNLSAIK